jgi:hypothetical protein
MAYVPVQRDAGRIMYESSMQRAGTIGGAVSGLFQALNQQQQAAQAAAQAKAEEDKQFNAKLKALESLVQTHKDKFNLSDEQVKQFLSRDPNDSAKTHYLKLGEFVERSLKASELEKTQAETQLKRLEAVKAIQGMPREQFDYSGIRDVAGQPGVVDITEMKISGRGPAAPVAPVSVGATGGTLVDMATGATRIIPAIPQAGSGEMIVYPGGTAPQAPAGLPAPTSLPRFLPSGSLLKPQGQAVPTEALEAMRPSPAAAPAPQPTRPYVVELEGGEAQRKRLAAEQVEKTKQEREAQSAANILVGIGLIKRNLDKTTFGLEPVGMYPGARKLVSQAAVNVARGIDTVIANIGFSELEKLKAVGGTLGQIAIRELELLQQLRGSLSQDLDKPEFRAAVDRLETEAENIIARRKLLEGVAAEKRNTLTEDERKQYEALGGAFPKTTTRLKVNVGASPGESTIGEPTPNTSRFTGADRQAYEWLMKNPKDPRADQIRRKLGL